MPVKGVIVAAGYGSRFLPITRCVPKEMLPIIDRPAIDLVVQEMIDAGIQDILVITSRRKKVLEDWFDRDPELEAAYAQRPDPLGKLSPPSANVTFIRQQTMRGTGHALLLARNFAGHEPLVVAYPDDLFGSPNLSQALIAVHTRTGGSVLSALNLPHEDMSRYGVLDVDGERVNAIVEKPAPGTEPSTLVSMGRYLYTPEVFDLLADGLASHADGEFYPQDAINTLAARGKVFCCPIEGERFDTGTPYAYTQTVVRQMLLHPDHGGPFSRWLREQIDNVGG